MWMSIYLNHHGIFRTCCVLEAFDVMVWRGLPGLCRICINVPNRKADLLFSSSSCENEKAEQAWFSGRKCSEMPRIWEPCQPAAHTISPSGGWHNEALFSPPSAVALVGLKPQVSGCRFLTPAVQANSGYTRHKAPSFYSHKAQNTGSDSRWFSAAQRHTGQSSWSRGHDTAAVTVKEWHPSVTKEE